MATEALNASEILSATSAAIAELTDLMSAVDEDKVNTVPYEGSWTAPQLLRHVTKSINGMTGAMQMDAQPANRDPSERIDQLKNIFLDFSKKLTQPEFIVPEDRVYEKQAAINELNKSFNRFKDNAVNANLDELVEGLPLGPITKLEIIHFVLYHTQRHLHQMKKICGALSTESLTQFLTSMGYIAIPFRQNVAGQLLINVKINDVEGVYILDSGAGQTVVDTKQMDTLKLKVNYDESALTGGGVGAHSIANAPSYKNKIEINNFKIDNQVVAVMSLDTAWESLAQVGAHDELFGIIGVDILKAGNAIIVFSTMTLYLKQP